MKLVPIIALLIFPIHSFASVSCAGETYSGVLVTVNVDTVGTMGSIQSGEVTISSNGENSHSYTIHAEEISQFYETAYGDPENAIVGMAAYIGNENPVEIRYVGKNYSYNPTKELRSPNHKKQSGNSMRVWKGPGFVSSEQFSFADVVCSVSLDP